MWEPIEEGKYPSRFVSERLKVPGGWIVRSVYLTVGDNGSGIAQTFVSDLSHTWKLEKK